MRLRLACAALAAVALGLPDKAADAPARAAGLKSWVVEQMSGGRVYAQGDAIVIEDANGCSLWWREKLQAPVEITYDVTAVSRGGPHDRVSDVNCFWMASDPKAPDGCPFATGHGRSGKFADYDSLQTYYVGMGGNTNSTTRFRRYDGHGARPLQPEHDLRAAEYLLKPNETYHIRLVARDGRAEYWCNGKRFFSVDDPQPLTSGWFAIRTVRSHLEIRNLRISSK